MANVVAENWDGTTYQEDGVETLSMYNDEGGIETFVHDSLVAEPVEKTVELDFSGGDMIVTPEEGQTFSSITIPVPENAIPENIRENVNLAGIVGAMAAGGGGGSPAKIAVGEFTLYSGTVSHNLGVVPDIIIMTYSQHTRITKTNTTGKVFFFVGFSRAFVARYPELPSSWGALRFSGSSGDNQVYFNTDYFIDGDTGDINSANAETFVASSFQYLSGSPATWLAIGGLT